MEKKLNIILKRIFDIIVSILGILILSPVFFGISLAIYFKLGLPIMFIQKRPGLNGEPFFMYKFRSMTNEKDSTGKMLPGDERLTPFGIKLRSSSLDELPELVNVLKGDMSLVGPRPLKMEYLSRYTKRQARRHEVRPGITGWAQVNGRNTVSWEKRFEMDVWYVDHQSLWLDIKIIFKTLGTVFSKKGISPDGDRVITTPFQGSTSGKDEEKNVS